jgi:putative peptidoglycan lipid II flippase
VWTVRDPAIRKMAALSAYTIGYVVVNQLGYLLIPVISAPIRGGYTAYTNAFIFFQLPHGVFAVSVITALLPQMSEHAVARDWVAYREALSRGLRLTALVLVPAAIGYLVLAEPIVRLLVQHGNATRASADLIARVLSVFVLGLLSFSTFQLLLRAFYALQDTRTTLLVNVVSVTANVVVDIVLFTVLPTGWKVAGLAAGHAAAYTLGAGLLLWRLRGRVGGLDGTRVTGAVARMLAAGVVMGLVVATVARVVQGLAGAGMLATLATVLTGVIAGLLAYLAAAQVLRVQELRLLFAVVQRRRAPAE